MLRACTAFLVTALLVATSTPETRPAAGQDRIYVSSRGTSEVRIYDAATGDFLETLFSAQPSARGNPQEVLFGPDGMLYVTFTSGEEDLAIHRYDPDSGQYLGFFSSRYALDSPTKMKIGPDGNFYVSQWGESKFNVAVFDGETGRFIREATNNASRMNVMGMAWDDQGRLYVAHYGDSFNGNVRRFDSEGNAEKTVVSSSVLDGPVDIWFNEDGSLNVVDWRRGRVDAFDLSTGEAVRNRASGMQRSEGWTLGPDGLLYVCDWQTGEINRYDASSGEFVDTFIDDPGLVQPNSIKFSPPEDVSNDSGASETPFATLLTQNYPNPFNPATTIRFSLSQTSDVRLTVFDLLGRVVATPVDDVRPAGEYSIRFEAGDLPSGSYVYRLETAEKTVSRVMTLLRQK